MCLNAGHAHQKTLNSHEEERLKHGADRRHELIEAAPKTVCPTESQLRRNPQFQAFSRSRRIGSPFSHTFSLSLSFLLPLMSYRPPFATPAPAISIVVGRQAGSAVEYCYFRDPFDYHAPASTVLYPPILRQQRARLLWRARSPRK